MAKQLKYEFYTEEGSSVPPAEISSHSKALITTFRNKRFGKLALQNFSKVYKF